MPKESGMGDSLWVDQYDLGGDVSAVSNLGGGPNLWEVTDIKKSAVARIGLQRDGRMEFNSYFNTDAGAGAEGAFTALKTLPTADRQLTYWHGAAVGAPAASLISKQINYDGNREQSGAFTFGVSAQANGWGLEWGNALTAQARTDTTATSPATGADLGASPTSYSFGWVAYLHVLAFTGTSVTVTLQDSADNSAFTSLTGGAFAAASARGVQRLASSSTTATVRRYVRAITTGTFTNAVFGVNFVRFEQAQT